VQQQQLIPPAANVKVMGVIPEKFNGNHQQAENFLEKIKQFLHLNQDVPGYNSPIKKVAFTLTLMEGPEVAGWVCYISKSAKNM
jgi:hypothetical protein